MRGENSKYLCAMPAKEERLPDNFNTRYNKLRKHLSASWWKSLVIKIFMVQPPGLTLSAMLSRKHCRLPKPSAERQTRSPVPVQDRHTISSCNITLLTKCRYKVRRWTPSKLQTSFLTRLRCRVLGPLYIIHYTMYYVLWYGRGDAQSTQKIFSSFSHSDFANFLQSGLKVKLYGHDCGLLVFQLILNMDIML